MYIGKSNNPRTRFGCHRRGDGYTLIGKWCKAMHSIGLNPIYKVIDMSYGDIHKMEMDYIFHFKYLGQAFFNINVYNYMTTYSKLIKRIA